MNNNHQRTKTIILTSLLLFVFCVLPFLVAPSKDWYVIFIIFGVPTMSFYFFGKLAEKFSLNTKSRARTVVSYVLIGFVAFLMSAIVFYLTNKSWGDIVLYSAIFGILSILASLISIFLWDKIRQ